jgi:Bacterial RNA polymerase, alpha chain C terminal domain
MAANGAPLNATSSAIDRSTRSLLMGRRQTAALEFRTLPSDHGKIWRRRRLSCSSYARAIEETDRMHYPTPELPDDTPIGELELSTRIRNVLEAAGLKTVGEVREISDEILLSFNDCGKNSVAYLREALGLPSTDGVRPRGKEIRKG